MGGGHNSRDGIIAGINVTPLVDITLVLLVIFIVTAKIMVAPAVPMDLPRASQSTEVQVVLSILLPKEGPVLVNGSAVADDAVLKERAKQALASQPDLRVVIQADGDVTHRRVIAVIDDLKAVGVTRIAFGALAEPQP